MPFELSPRDRARLAGVHPDLVRVVERAAQLTAKPFAVIEGVRTLERQRQLVAKGASKTLNSRHLPKSGSGGYGCAVDLAPLTDTDNDGDLEISWRWPDFWPVVAAMEQAAIELDVPVTHGARWRSFPDGPHHELLHRRYPD